MSAKRSIVFFDIDGTIFEMGKGTPDSTRAAIRELKRRGHIPVVCTGRPKSTLFPEILDLGFSGIIGGAGTYVEYEGQVLRSILLDRELQCRMVRELTKRGCLVILEGPQYISYRNREETSKCFRVLERLEQEYPKRLKHMDEETDQACKLTAFFESEEMIPEIEEELKLSEHFYLARYERMPFVEMMPKGIHKADGIRVMLKYLQIPLSRTYAFGDGPNDLEMLQYVKYGTAMGNAEAGVLAAAKYRTEGIWEDGVARALKRYGLIDGGGILG